MNGNVLFVKLNGTPSTFVNTIRTGGGCFKSLPPPIFCTHAFNFRATLLCVGDFFQQNNLK